MGLEHRVGSVEQLAVVLGNHSWATDPGTAAVAAPQQLELLAQQAVTSTTVTVVMPEPRLPAALARLALLVRLSLLGQQAMTAAATVAMVEIASWGRLATFAAVVSVDL